MCDNYIKNLHGYRQIGDIGSTGRRDKLIKGGKYLKGIFIDPKQLKGVKDLYKKFTMKVLTDGYITKCQDQK